MRLTTEYSRGDLLRGKFTPYNPAIRPPWAVREGLFLELCNGCGDCIGRCPTGVLKKSRGAYPVVEFDHDQCTFCGLCADVCKPLALNRGRGLPPWSLAAAVDPSCLSSGGVSCRVCGDRCHTGAISFRLAVGGRATPVIDSTLCSGCGACVAPCPVGALEIHNHKITSEDTVEP